MEYIYGAMLLNSAGKEVNEANLSKIVDATGEKSDAAMVKAVCASLDGVDIEKTISEAAVAAPAAAPAAGEAKEEKKEEVKEEDKAAASAGLGALFG